MTAPRLTEKQVDAITQVADNLSTMIDISAGHMRQLEAAGYSHETAEMLASSLHARLLMNAFDTPKPDGSNSE